MTGEQLAIAEFIGALRLGLRNLGGVVNPNSSGNISDLESRESFQKSREFLRTVHIIVVQTKPHSGMSF